MVSPSDTVNGNQRQLERNRQLYGTRRSPFREQNAGLGEMYGSISDPAAAHKRRLAYEIDPNRAPDAEMFARSPVGSDPAAVVAAGNQIAARDLGQRNQLLPPTAAGQAMIAQSDPVAASAIAANAPRTAPSMLAPGGAPASAMQLASAPQPSLLNTNPGMGNATGIDRRMRQLAAVAPMPVKAAPPTAEQIAADATARQAANNAIWKRMREQRAGDRQVAQGNTDRLMEQRPMIEGPDGALVTDRGTPAKKATPEQMGLNALMAQADRKAREAEMKKRHDFIVARANGPLQGRFAEVGPNGEPSQDLAAANPERFNQLAAANLARRQVEADNTQKLADVEMKKATLRATIDQSLAAANPTLTPDQRGQIIDRQYPQLAPAKPPMPVAKGGAPHPVGGGGGAPVLPVGRAKPQDAIDMMPAGPDRDVAQGERDLADGKLTKHAIAVVDQHARDVFSGSTRLKRWLGSKGVPGFGGATKQELDDLTERLDANGIPNARKHATDYFRRMMK